jgi:hypothetical protein
MSSAARRARRMPAKVKARMLREIQSYPRGGTCGCGRPRPTSQPMCFTCMGGAARVRL